jgi:hypothetical protein
VTALGAIVRVGVATAMGTLGACSFALDLSGMSTSPSAAVPKQYYDTPRTQSELCIQCWLFSRVGWTVYGCKDVHGRTSHVAHRASFSMRPSFQHTRALLGPIHAASTLGSRGTPSRSTFDYHD